MIIAAIVVGIALFLWICYGHHLEKNVCCSIYDGMTVGIVLSVLVAIETAILVHIVTEPIPTPLDVYRGNTELKITSVNGIPTDTVVVFKNNGY